MEKNKSFNIRMPDSLIEKLKETAGREEEKTGYKITISALIVKVLQDYCNKYK